MQIAERSVEVKRRRRQKNMHLTLGWDGKLRVTCNLRMSEKRIAEFVRESGSFIAAREMELEQERSRYPTLQVLSGEVLSCSGLIKTLEVIWSWDSRVKIREDSNTIEVSAPLTSTAEERRQALAKYLRRQANRRIRTQVERWTQMMGVEVGRISIRDQATRWGSCSTKGDVNFNWKLILMPPEISDYVVVHELAHTRHFNHSQEFWRLVESYLPEYQFSRRWLRQNERRLKFLFP